MSTKLEVTPKTVLFAFAIVIGAWIVFQIRDIIKLLFIAFIFMAALRPAVDALERYKVPRILAIGLTYAVVIAVLSFFGTIVFPPLVTESARFISAFPLYFESALPLSNIDLNVLIEQITPLSQNVARVTLSVFSNLITILTVAVLTFYFLLERNNLKYFLSAFTGAEMGERLVMLVRQVEVRLGAWVRGQLLLGIIIGLASFLGLSLLNIPYALPLALIAGLLEMVPIIGPIISAIPSVLIALTISPGLALATVALYFVIQQLENNLIVPLVMQKTVGLPPLASLIALLIGGQLGGVLGILLAVPTLLILQTLLQGLWSQKTQ